MTVPNEHSFADGFNGTLSPGNMPAVLSIDLMRAYFEPGSPLCLPSSDCLPVAAEVLAAARRGGTPVVHLKVRYGPGGADGGVFIAKIPALRAFIGETTAGELMPEVEPLPTEPVITKQYASGFFGTSLGSMLQTQGIDTVVLVGTSTSGCVRATAVDAIQHGFVPIVVADAVGDREKAVHQASLYDLQAKYAEVVNSRTVIRYLEDR